MIKKSIRIAKKGGRVVCCFCGVRIQPGMVYVRIGSRKSSYCIMCNGPGNEAWEELK